MEIELKLFGYNILVDTTNPKEVINTVNGLVNDLELYNQEDSDNYSSAKYARTREALNELLEATLKTK
jgi:hypothetical protein|tara:strand:+ start:991 stop:1194 length:204 start_codon:yes stop_codon:yes gene_type:complete